MSSRDATTQFMDRDSKIQVKIRFALAHYTTHTQTYLFASLRLNTRVSTLPKHTAGRECQSSAHVVTMLIPRTSLERGDACYAGKNNAPLRMPTPATMEQSTGHEQYSEREPELTSYLPQRRSRQRYLPPELIALALPK